MIADSPNSPDDLLARAEAALHRTAINEGPSRETLDRTIAALRQAESAPRVVPLLRRGGTQRLMKIAAVFIIAVTVVFGIAERIHFHPTVAFGEVAQKLHDAQTLIYRMRMESPELKEPQVAKVYVKWPDLMRTEFSEGQVAIGNRASGKTISLDPKEKTATIIEVERSKPASEEKADQDELIEHLRNLVKADGQPAGQKEIGGRKTLGFRAKEGQLDWLIWADAQTKEPLGAEVSMSRGVKVTFSDFELNRPLDDALFSLDVPDGYKIRKTNIEVLPGEESVARFLRAYAVIADNAFPPRLDDWAAISRHFGNIWEKDGKQPKSEKLSVEAAQLASSMAGTVAFLMPLEEYTYRPEGAELGNAKRMIFWYRPAVGKEYRALYADLHWSDISPDQLPQ